MSDLFPNAMPLQGFLGGLMIGLASAILLLGLGRIAGISGLVARASGLAITGAPQQIAAAFVIGLPLGAWLWHTGVAPVASVFPTSYAALIMGGLLVGFGTRLGSGCTSGHGVCGVARLSPRSLTATALFMLSGFVTVAALRFGGLL